MAWPAEARLAGPRDRPDGLKAHRSIKAALDPDNIMNPGKILLIQDGPQRVGQVGPPGQDVLEARAPGGPMRVADPIAGLRPGPIDLGLGPLELLFRGVGSSRSPSARTRASSRRIAGRWSSSRY